MRTTRCFSFLEGLLQRRELGPRAVELRNENGFRVLSPRQIVMVGLYRGRGITSLRRPTSLLKKRDRQAWRGLTLVDPVSPYRGGSRAVLAPARERQGEIIVPVIAAVHWHDA